MVPGRCSDPPAGTHKCGYVTEANYFSQFVVTVTISIGRRVLIELQFPEEQVH